jgi:hypothetical protein
MVSGPIFEPAYSRIRRCIATHSIRTVLLGCSQVHMAPTGTNHITCRAAAKSTWHLPAPTTLHVGPQPSPHGTYWHQPHYMSGRSQVHMAPTGTNHVTKYLIRHCFLLYRGSSFDTHSSQYHHFTVEFPTKSVLLLSTEGHTQYSAECDADRQLRPLPS